MLMRRQFVLTLIFILMPIIFGIWYAADALFSTRGPAD